MSNAILEQLRKDYPEQDAVLISVSELPKSQVLKITRGWTDVTSGHTVDDAALMAEYTSPDNPEPQRWMRDPIIGQNTKREGLFWCVGVAAADKGSQQGNKGVYQTLQQVYDLEDGSIANLSDVPHLDSQDDELIRAFGITSGRGNKRVLVWNSIFPSDANKTLCDTTFTDQDLTAGFAPGWRYQSRKWTEREDGTVEFMVVFAKSVWRRWAPTTAWAASTDYSKTSQITVNDLWYDATTEHTSTADFATDLAAGKWRLTRDPDTTSPSDTGRKTEARQRRWTGFDKADMATIKAALSDDAGDFADTGYHILEVSVTDNQDGSVSFTQTETSKVSEVASVDNNLEGSEVLSAHDFEPITVTRKRSVYRRFSSAELLTLNAGGANEETTPTGYVFISQDPDIDEHGLYTRVYRYELMSCVAWAGNTKSTFNYGTVWNYGRDGERWSRTWLNIAIADVTTAQLNLSTDTTDWRDANFHVLEVAVQSNGNGSANITQVVLKQTTVKAATDARMAGSRLISPHDFQYGTVTTYRSIYSDYSATELLAISETSPGASYKLVSVSPDIESNGLFTRVYSYEAVSFPAWDHDTGAADITMYRQPGTNQREIVKAWLFIARSDAATAEAACRNGTGNFAFTSGYMITDVNIANNGNGSVNIVQVQRQKLDGDAAAAATEQLNAHGWFPGVLTTVVTRYSDWQKDGANGLPTGTAATAGSSIVSNTPNLQSNGLWGRTIITETPTWEKGWADKVLVAQSDTGGHGLSETHIAGGISQAALVDTEMALAQSPDTGRVIANVTKREGRAGERILARTQRIVYSTGDPVVTRLREEEGSSPRLLRREWRRRTADVKTSLIGTSGAAVSDASYAWPGDVDGEGSPASSTFTHLDVVVDDHGDGAYTVTQYLAGLSGSTVNVYFQNQRYVYKTYTNANTSNNYTKTLKYIEYMHAFSTEASANTFLDGLTPVAGTANVVKRSPIMFVATALVLVDVGDWTTWEAPTLDAVPT